MGLSIVCVWAAKFNRPDKGVKGLKFTKALIWTKYEDKRKKVAASEDPGTSSFTLSVSNHQSCLCCAEKAGPQDLRNGWDLIKHGILS